MVDLTGGMMNDAATAVALTEMNGKLELVLQGMNHQTELMQRNRADATKDIAECQADIVATNARCDGLSTRCDTLEKINEQYKATVKTVAVIASLSGTAFGVAATVLSKFI